MQKITDFWKTTIGKLTIGGCGLLSICFACTVCGALIRPNDVPQKISSSSTETATESSLSETSTELLPTEVPPEPLSTEIPTAAALLPTIPLPTEAPATEALVIGTPTLEALKPVVIAGENDINLRSGPGTDYEVVGTLTSGESLEIVGRNADSSWWQVSTSDGLVWIAASVVTVKNIDDNIAVVETPTPLIQPTIPSLAAPTDPLPQPTVAPAAPREPAFTGETVDPPWWPCAEGQVKGNRDSGKYHVPEGQFYAKTYEGVDCFNTAAEAGAAGYVRSQR